jgi:hypothetical protein
MAIAHREPPLTAATRTAKISAKRDRPGEQGARVRRRGSARPRQPPQDADDNVGGRQAAEHTQRAALVPVMREAAPAMPKRYAVVDVRREPESETKAHRLGHRRDEDACHQPPAASPVWR